VAAGEYDAGALNERTFKKLNETGSKLGLWRSFPSPGGPGSPAASSLSRSSMGCVRRCLK